MNGIVDRRIWEHVLTKDSVDIILNNKGSTVLNFVKWMKHQILLKLQRIDQVVKML